MRQVEKAVECVVCGDLLPEDRYLTCSHDCYIQYKVDKEIDKRRAAGKGKEERHVCKNCKQRFYPKWRSWRPGMMHMNRFTPEFCSLRCRQAYEKKEKDFARQAMEAWKKGAGL